MIDRADELARRLVRENTDDVEEYADLEFAIVAALRTYAEEIAAHWKREAGTGAAMLAAIHRGLGLDGAGAGGISVQDVLDRVRHLVEDGRREERETWISNAALTRGEKR